MKKIYLLPNLFTTASLFCGLLAILNVFDVATSARLATYRYELSCWLILASAILDMLDGWVARMTHTESSFGVQYDSLADLVAFGVAPAILIYTRISEIDNPLVAEVITPVFAICGALRLARFNVQKSTTEKLSFTGLPIPAAAGTVVSGFLFFQKIDPDWNREFVLRVLPGDDGGTVLPHGQQHQLPEPQAVQAGAAQAVQRVAAFRVVCRACHSVEKLYSGTYFWGVCGVRGVGSRLGGVPARERPQEVRASDSGGTSGARDRGAVRPPTTGGG